MFELFPYLYCLGDVLQALQNVLVRMGQGKLKQKTWIG